MRLSAHEIGGGIARRTFTSGGVRIVAGRRFSGDELRAMPAANRNSLIENRFIEVWPKVDAEPAADSQAEPVATERFTVSRGFGKYDVVEGFRLNEAPLSKDEAVALAGAGAGGVDETRETAPH